MVAGLMAGGCSSTRTIKAFYEPITAELQQHNYAGAVARIEAARADNKYSGKDRFLYFLDAGLAYHYAATWDSSTIRLHDAERTAEELFKASFSRGALSFLLNDNVLEYSGEDYEVLYTNLFNTMNYLAKDDFDGAFVEVRRANLKLQELEDKYADVAKRWTEASREDTSHAAIDYDVADVRFNNDAFARYLSMHMYAAEGLPDDAELDYRLLVDAFASQPNIYPFPVPDVQWRPAERDHGLLSVVGLVGLSPVKEPLNLRIRTDKQLDLVTVIYDDGTQEGSVFANIPAEISEDYYFKLAIPQIVDRPSIVRRIEVTVDSMVVGELQMIEHVGAVARETYEARKSLILFKTVARAIVKGLAAHEAKAQVKDDGVAGWLGKLAIDVVTDLTENADVRCSRLLPGYIYVGDFSLPVGRYDIRVAFYDGYDQLIATTDYTNYEVRRADFNLIQAVSLN